MMPTVRDWVELTSSLEADYVEEYQIFQLGKTESGTHLNVNIQSSEVPLSLKLLEMTTSTSHRFRSMDWKRREFQSQRVPPNSLPNQLVKNTETLLLFLSMMNKFILQLMRLEVKEWMFLPLNQELTTFLSRELMTHLQVSANQNNWDETLRA